MTVQFERFHLIWEFVMIGLLLHVLFVLVCTLLNFLVIFFSFLEILDLCPKYEICASMPLPAYLESHWLDL
jgi:hypothetical protein